MGLIEVQDGQKVVVSHIEGGRMARQKLMDMGLIPGVPVTIIKQGGSSPMILKVMGRQIMLGHGMARKIFVR